MAESIVYRQRRRDKSGNIRMVSEIVRRIPSQDELKSLVAYDPETGVFTHIRSRGKGRAGDIAGKINRVGYWEMRVCNRLFPAHRLAWLYMTGELPEMPMTIDHINGVRSDNRWRNLRLATMQQQTWNTTAHHRNKTGLKGAWPCRTTGRWLAQITHNGECIWLGRYNTAEEAHRAWVNASIRIRGHEWTMRAINEDVV